MPMLRLVEAWPSTRYPDRAWHQDDDLAAFLASSRGVFDLYSDELPAAGQTARTSSIRFMPVEDRKSRNGFEVDVFTQPLEGFDMVRVAVPAGFAALPTDARVAASLDVVHTTVCALGDLRGWDQERLREVRARAVGRGLRYSWTSAWKTSPGRHHRGRAVYWLDEDGQGHVQLETQRTNDDEVVARSAPALAFMTAEGFRRSAATLRWASPTLVSVVPWAGLFGDDGGTLELETTMPLEPLRLPRPLTGTTGTTAVTTRVVTGLEWMDDPDTDWISLQEITGPGIYSSEVQRVVRMLAADAEFRSWWATTPFRLLSIRSVVLDRRTIGYSPKPGSRKSGEDLVLTIVLARADLPPKTDVEPMKQRARSDLHAALVELAQKRKLPPPPTLPERVSTNSRQRRAATRSEASPS